MKTRWTIEHGPDLLELATALLKNGPVESFLVVLQNRDGPEQWSLRNVHIEVISTRSSRSGFFLIEGSFDPEEEFIPRATFKGEYSPKEQTGWLDLEEPERV